MDIMKIGIRKEDKSRWERRVPLVPEDIRDLARQGIQVVVESSPNRAISDGEFAAAGVEVAASLQDCPVIVGIKEIPPERFEPGKVYLFFSHVIKGQPYNMPMLRRMMAQGATLVDYERVVDEHNRRLIFFGRHAGLAGMVNSLWALGRRLLWEGLDTPFARLRQAREYPDLKAARIDLAEIAESIRSGGLPAALVPMVCGFTGYGNVSLGAQEIFDMLPHEVVTPEELSALPSGVSDRVFKVVFREEDCFAPLAAGEAFDLSDYFARGRRAYRGVFELYAELLTLWVNCVYWDERYPRLLTLEGCRRMWADGRRPRLRVIGDISCDPDGSVQCTVKPADPGSPVYVYDPESGRIADGVAGNGPVIMAVDILPAEIPRESSAHFSAVLKGFVPALASADYSVPFEDLGLPEALKRAVILYRGELTPDYRYLRAHVEAHSGADAPEGE
ncbi:MAG: bifunctional lysine ketoglutarate reductase /saccharopine dehydrogenase family protein [Desulfobacterales bacterium]